MADDELEAIRARRMAELQAQYGGQVCYSHWYGMAVVQAPGVVGCTRVTSP